MVAKMFRDCLVHTPSLPEETEAQNKERFAQGVSGTDLEQKPGSFFRCGGGGQSSLTIIALSPPPFTQGCSGGYPEGRGEQNLTPLLATPPNRLT